MNSIEENIFTIHGLWPDFKRPTPEKYEHCNKGNKIELDNLMDDSYYPDLIHNLNKYWVSNNMDNIYFWTHEYNKHGTCYTMKNQKEYIHYFEYVIQHFLEKKLHRLLSEEVRKYQITEVDNFKFVSLPYQEIMKILERKLNTSFALKCFKMNKKQFLKELFIYYDVSFKNIDMKDDDRGSCYPNSDILILMR